MPADLPLRRLHKPLGKKHFWPLAPVPAPIYGPLIMSGHVPASSQLAKPSMKKTALPPPSAGLADIAPSQSNPTSGLAQPPLAPHVSGMNSWFLFASSEFS